MKEDPPSFGIERHRVRFYKTGTYKRWTVKVGFTRMKGEERLWCGVEVGYEDYDRKKQSVKIGKEVDRFRIGKKFRF